MALNKAVGGTSVEEFLEATENALEACGMILKKVDKKKDRYAQFKRKIFFSNLFDEFLDDDFFHSSFYLQKFDLMS